MWRTQLLKITKSTVLDSTQALRLEVEIYAEAK